MSEENNNKSGWRLFFKIMAIVVTVFLLLVVIGFGLLVGACGTPRR
jgi:autotransporter translocation and assembly factor TamB